MKGVGAIYHMAPNVSPDEVAIGKAVISAAKRAGVEHFVFHSVLHPQIEAMPHHWRKLRVEELLLESDLPWTILQPTTHMQHILHIESDLTGIPRSVLPDTRLSLVISMLPRRRPCSYQPENGRPLNSWGRRRCPKSRSPRHCISNWVDP
jgi:uncharacterized protein YbjT (DUF2867 family)